MSDLTKKLIKIQGLLKAPKGQRNDFGNYNYRSCEDILEAVKPLCSAEGVLLTLSDEIEVVGHARIEDDGVVNDGDRVYVKTTARVTDGESVAFITAYAREALIKKGMDASQITGACSSYARKYALNGLFLIDDTKDADSQDNRTQQTETAKDPAKKAEAGTKRTLNPEDPEDKMRIDIGEWIMSICGMDEKKAPEKLAELTAFKGSKGMVAGVRTVVDLKGKRLKVSHSIIEKEHAAMFDVGPEEGDPREEAIDDRPGMGY